MSVTVEDRKRSHESYGEGHRRIDAESHREAEHDDRQGDADLNEGQRHAGNAGQSAERHERDEGQRQQHQRLAPKLVSENADQDHGEQVVHASQWMHEAMHHATRLPDADMRERGGGG
ncbi:hypothetical protein AUC71_10125 [Methyloceanibacter marginalis]|uniref:Uncharacterized protein n=1 Tax=Methyloceanibacter marginalis TaxID=1774971 RepID=A0A1E3WC06_9HYPH|nr:hypothetical protein AUC71_10125 [Methyloceanibacter marginalis]